MTASPGAVLLDTHAAIWLAEGTLDDKSAETLVAAGTRGDGVYVSPVSAWEIGLLARARGDRPARVDFWPDPQTWFADLLAKPIIKLAPFDAAIAIGASFLPGSFHDDPADRLLVATARAMRIPLMTRDKRIHGYAKTGRVEVFRC